MRSINPYVNIGQVTATGSGTSGKVRITRPAHGLVTGNKVLIAGMQGTTEANGYFTVTRIDDDNFDLDGTTYANVMTLGGIVSKIQIVRAKLMSGTGVTGLVVTAQVRYFASGLVVDTKSISKLVANTTGVELFRSHETQVTLLDKICIDNQSGATREVRIEIENYDLIERFENISVNSNEIIAGLQAPIIISSDGRTVSGPVDIP